MHKQDAPLWPPTLYTLLCCVPSQALQAGEQHRHQSMLTEAQLATARQKLRQHVASAARPLAMSGWEDLIDEAAADLQRLEAHVAAAAAHLIKLQVHTAAEWYGSGQRHEPTLLVKCR